MDDSRKCCEIGELRDCTFESKGTPSLFRRIYRSDNNAIRTLPKEGSRHATLSRTVLNLYVRKCSELFEQFELFANKLLNVVQTHVLFKWPWPKGVSSIKQWTNSIRVSTQLIAFLQMSKLETGNRCAHSGHLFARHVRAGADNGVREVVAGHFGGHCRLRVLVQGRLGTFASSTRAGGRRDRRLQLIRICHGGQHSATVPGEFVHLYTSTSFVHFEICPFLFRLIISWRLRLANYLELFLLPSTLMGFSFLGTSTSKSGRARLSSA